MVVYIEFCEGTTVEPQLSELRLIETPFFYVIPRTACHKTRLTLSPSVCCEKLTGADCICKYHTLSCAINFINIRRVSE
jgi:hypothetical protein